MGEKENFLFAPEGPLVTSSVIMNKQDFSPKTIALVPSKQRLTSTAGLGTLLEAFDRSSLKDQFRDCLPERVSPRSKGAYRLGLVQLASFLFGHDCLDDLNHFRKDPHLNTVMRGDTTAPRTMGDFLRDFQSHHLANLNKFLARQAKTYRLQLEKVLKKKFKPSRAPHLSIDSTSHIQSGSKMEGLAYNYKGDWCLDSQVIFDELGFCWDLELRSGNTSSGVGSSEQVRRAFKSYRYKDEKYLSGDSAYCNQEMIKTSMGLGVYFTFTANQGTTGWEGHIEEMTKWIPWEYTAEQKKWALENDKELPEVELGSFYWRPSWNEVLRLPVVVKRTKVDQGDLFTGNWKHYGVVTNLPLFNWSLQEVIEHHNKRGNAENFIREEKYGYDLKHFPCLQLKANHAYGLLAMVAHNILRWVAIHDRPARPRFAKGVRHKFLYIPGKIVSHARHLVMRVPVHFMEEVNQLRIGLQLQPYSALTAGGP